MAIKVTIQTLGPRFKGSKPAQVLEASRLLHQIADNLARQITTHLCDENGDTLAEIDLLDWPTA